MTGRRSGILPQWIALLCLAGCSGEPPPAGVLLAAVSAYDHRAAEAALAAGADPDERDDRGASSLHFAAGAGEVKLIELLLDEGANPDLADSRGITPLVAAISTGQTKAAITLIERGADVGPESLHPMPLAAAASRGNLEVLEALYADGARFPKIDPKQGHPIVLTYEPGHLEAFEWILRADSRPLRKSQLMVDLLSTAIRDGRAEWVEAMLAGGIEPNRPDSDGILPLYHAAYDGRLDLVRLLLGADADVDGESGDFGSPLFAAVRSDSSYSGEVLALLVAKRPASLEGRADGLTPLLLAALRHNTRAIDALLAAGSDVRATTPAGETALQLASGNRQIVSKLRSHGAE